MLGYIESLFDTLAIAPYEERAHVMRLKKYMNFIALGVEPDGTFDGVVFSDALGEVANVAMAKPSDDDA